MVVCNSSRLNFVSELQWTRVRPSLNYDSQVLAGSGKVRVVNTEVGWFDHFLELAVVGKYKKVKHVIRKWRFNRFQNDEVRQVIKLH